MSQLNIAKMKTNLKTTISGLAAIVLLAITGLFYAFKAENNNTRAIRTYYYNLNTLTGANQPSNWTAEEDMSELPECSGNDLPCRVQFNTTEYSDIADFLSQKTESQILNDSHVTRKSE